MHTWKEKHNHRVQRIGTQEFEYKIANALVRLEYIRESGVGNAKALGLELRVSAFGN